MRIINPTRSQFVAMCRGAGVEPPAWPLPKNGWQSQIFMSYKVVQSVLAQNKPKESASRMVLVVLAEFANEKGVCWPSMETIAARASLSVRHTNRIIRALQEAGHIEIQPGNGRTHPNKYRILLNPDTRVTVSSKETLTPMSPFNESETLTSEPETLTQLCPRNPDIAMSYEPPIEPPIEPPLSPQGEGERSNSVSSDSQNDSFSAFWEAYPKKRGRAAAQKAWKKLKPPLPKVLETLAAFEASREWRKDNGQFIPYPASWLNDGRWDDELPARRNRESVL